MSKYPLLSHRLFYVILCNTSFLGILQAFILCEGITAIMFCNIVYLEAYCVLPNFVQILFIYVLSEYSELNI